MHFLNFAVGQLLAILGYLAFLCLVSSVPLGLLADYLRSKLTGNGITQPRSSIITRDRIIILLFCNWLS